MPKAMLSPSVMCADPFRLGETLGVFEDRGVEYLHMDVMDGVFVPNICLGTDFIRRVKEKSAVPLDIHLMITDPEKKLSWFSFGAGDIVSVHIESGEHIDEALGRVREKGAKAFLALSPDTPPESLLPYLGLIDGVVVMTVYPGFAGQKMAPGSLEKIAAVRRLLDENGRETLPVEVDGNVSFINAPLMRKAGADIFVSGSSGVFRPGELGDNIDALYALLEGEETA